MSTVQFYETQAADCRRQAAESPLANVRERCLSAATAWDAMADRLRRAHDFRAADAARKEAQVG